MNKCAKKDQHMLKINFKNEKFKPFIVVSKEDDVYHYAPHMQKLTYSLWYIALSRLSKKLNQETCDDIYQSVYSIFKKIEDIPGLAFIPKETRKACIKQIQDIEYLKSGYLNLVESIALYKNPTNRDQVLFTVYRLADKDLLDLLGV